MSDGKIEQVPDKKGSHERVTGHATSADTGRTVVPSSIGTTRGAQLGRDHTVAAPSTMVMPDGSRVPINPLPLPPVNVASPPPDVAAALEVVGLGPRRPAPSPTAALMAEEEGAPAPAPTAPAAREDRISTAAFQPEPAAISITLKSLPKEPVIRWRARYHGIVVTPTTVVLVWDSRSKHAESPLLPVDTGDPTKLKMIVQKLNVDDDPLDKPVLPFTLDVMDCGLAFKHGPFEYFVFVRDNEPEADQPEAPPPAPQPRGLGMEIP